jgi:hypothetical protein
LLKDEVSNLGVFRKLFSELVKNGPKVAHGYKERVRFRGRIGAGHVRVLSVGQICQRP